MDSVNKSLIELIRVKSDKSAPVKAALNKFYKLLDEHEIKSADDLPRAFKTYETLVMQLKYPDIIVSIKRMLRTHPTFVLDHSNLIYSMMEKFSIFNKWMFNFLILNVNKYLDKMSKAVWCLISKSPLDEAKAFIDKIIFLPPQQSGYLVKIFGRLYFQIPSLRTKISSALVDFSNKPGTDLGSLFSSLYFVVDTTNTKAPLCIKIIKQHLDDSNMTAYAAKRIMDVVTRIHDIPKYKKQAVELTKIIKAHPIGQRKVIKRDIARILGDTDALRSHTVLGQRVPKTPQNKNGWTEIDTIPSTQPCVLCFGGNNTNSSPVANGYLSAIEKLLRQNRVNVDKISMYGLIYDFGERFDSKYSFDDRTARTLLQQQHKRDVKTHGYENIDEKDPLYVKELFNRVFLNKICENGKKLPVKEACKRIRNITIIAHCHGGYTFLKIEELMQQKMRELGYTSAEMATIQKQLLCIAYAPYCPLGVSKSTMISFASVADNSISHYNNFEKQIQKQERFGDFRLSWFPDNLGNVFVTPRTEFNSKYQNYTDHDFPGYRFSDKEINNPADIFFAFFKNAVVNGIRSSLKGKPVPSVKELVCGNNPNLKLYFLATEKNGRASYKMMLANLMGTKSRSPR